MTTATMTWTRITRALGSDHNPLRRRADLLAAWIAPAVAAIFLILSPLAAGGAVMWAHAHNAAVGKADRRLHSTPAVLLQAVPGPLETNSGANNWVTWTPARWTEGGRPYQGDIPATSGSSQGARVPVWLDPAGRVQTPPLSADQAHDRVLLAALAALAALAMALTALGLAGRWALNRRRLAAWEADWRLTGPGWSHQAW